MNILNDKKRAKWRADIKRRINAQKNIDFYYNKHEDYCFDVIDERLDTREAKHVKKYFEYENLTEYFIDAISIIFRVAPAIEYVEENETKSETLDEMLTDTMFVALLRDINKLTNLNYVTGVIPQIRDGQLELDILTPNNFFIEQKENDPTKVERVYYQVGIYQDSPNTSERIDIYHFWDKTGKYSCTVDNDNGSISNVEKLEAPNYNGEIPVIFFKNYIPIDSFFLDKNNPIVDKNLQIDIRLTNLNIMEDYNIPQRINLGARADDEIKLGFTLATNIPRKTDESGEAYTGDSKYIRPDSPIMNEWELIQNRVKTLGTTLGMSQDAITGKQFTSGYHLALSKQEIIQKNREQRFYYTKPIKDLIRIMIITAQQGGLYTELNEEDKLKVDYGEISFDESPQTKAQIRKAQLENQTASQVDFIMQDNPDLTREEAKIRLDEIRTEQERFNRTARFEQQLEGLNE